MEAERLSMSKKEQDRSEVIRLYVEGYIKQKDAAKRVGISTRQIRNVAHAYRLHGAHGLITRESWQDEQPQNTIGEQAVCPAMGPNAVLGLWPDSGP